MGVRYELLRRQDDFAVIQQFNQLYMKVRAWSIEFLGGIKDSEIAPEVLERLNRTIFGGAATCRGSSASGLDSPPSSPYLSSSRSPSQSSSRSPSQSSLWPPSKSSSRSPSQQPWLPVPQPRSSSRSPSRPASRRSARSLSPPPSPRDLRKILKNKTLHRHAVESLVGVTISEMLNKPDGFELDEVVNTLYETVTGFAVPRAPCNHDQLKQELHNILKMAWSLSDTCKQQPSANFVVSYPKIVPGQKPMYNPAIMEDKSRRGCEEWGERPVGMLLFPGMFKNANGVRTCMVKIKVVCTDEMNYTPPVFRQVSYA